MDGLVGRIDEGEGKADAAMPLGFRGLLDRAQGFQKQRHLIVALVAIGEQQQTPIHVLDRNRRRRAGTPTLARTWCKGGVLKSADTNVGFTIPGRRI